MPETIALGDVDISTTSLRQEMQTYKDNIKKLLDDEGRWVLIIGSQIKGIFDSYEEALDEGYRLAGLKPFLAKQIMGREQVHLITRGVSLK